MSAKNFKMDIRVRYEETDQMGVVYYANYFIWFEVARTEHLRSLGIVYKNLESKGFFLVVAEANCIYKSPAKYDDILEIETAITDMKNTSLTYKYYLRRGEKLIAEGSTSHVFVNTEGKPTKIPEEVREAFMKQKLLV